MSFRKTWFQSVTVPWVFKVLYGIILIYIMQVILCSSRAFIVSSLSIAQSAFVFCSNYTGWGCAICKFVCMYKQVSIIITVLDTASKYIMGAILSVEFFILLFLLGLSFRVWKYAPLRIYLIIPVITVAFLISLFVMFRSCCGIYHGTAKILVKDHGELLSGLGKMFRSMCPIAIPILSVGIMDNEIEGNNFTRIAVEEANLLIMTRKLFKL